MRQALEVYNYIKVIISSSIPDWVEESPQEEIELGDLHILGAGSRCSGDSLLMAGLSYIWLDI